MALRIGAHRVPISVTLALAVIAVVVVWALVPGLVAPQDPDAIDVAARWETPSSAHLLGTDDLGRDILSRVIAGTAAAVGGPVLIALGSVLIALVLGALAGYHGGWLDLAVSRGTDVLFALPALLIVIVVVGVLEGGYFVAVAVLIVLFVPVTLRLVRSATIEQRGRPYVEAARLQGTSAARILRIQIVPNLAPVAGAAVLLNFTYGLIGLAALSFLGFGGDAGDASWGRMVADNRIGLAANPWATLAPGLAIVVTAVAVNLLGDYFYERHANRGRAR